MELLLEPNRKHTILELYGEVSTVFVCLLIKRLHHI